MEEIHPVSPKFKQLQIKHSPSASVHLPKSISKSRIKMMQGKIFWRRNSFESSLQKIISKEKDNSPDKLKEFKSINAKVAEEQEQLDKKLSFPKIREVFRQTRNNSQFAKQPKQKKSPTQTRQASASSSIVPPEQFHEQRQKCLWPYSNESATESISKIVSMYKSRLQNQLQTFEFQSIGLQPPLKKKGKKPKLQQIQLEPRTQDTQSNSSLPSWMLQSLNLRLGLR